MTGSRRGCRAAERSGDRFAWEMPMATVVAGWRLRRGGRMYVALSVRRRTLHAATSLPLPTIACSPSNGESRPRWRLSGSATSRRPLAILCRARRASEPAERRLLATRACWLKFRKGRHSFLNDGCF